MRNLLHVNITHFHEKIIFQNINEKTVFYSFASHVMSDLEDK